MYPQSVDGRAICKPGIYTTQIPEEHTHPKQTKKKFCVAEVHKMTIVQEDGRENG